MQQPERVTVTVTQPDRPAKKLTIEWRKKHKITKRKKTPNETIEDVKGKENCKESNAKGLTAVFL